MFGWVKLNGDDDGLLYGDVYKISMKLYWDSEILCYGSDGV